MANPFLFTEEEMAEEVPSQETCANPFLMDDAAEEEDAGQVDNPFFDQGGNPFADLQSNVAEVEAPAVATGMNLFMAEPDESESVNTSFFDTTIHDPDELAATPIQINVSAGVGGGVGDFYSSEDELERTKKPGPPPRPGPPIAAQHLISTVAGQLDLASHDLLGRIPVTRTPSPVSMRDLHSPSPTPEDNLLDCTNDQMESDLVQDLPVDTKPPAPARPPPRPNPPPKPEPLAVMTQPQAQAVPQEQDIMDMFGVEETAPAPVRPPPPKTKEDILSLFSSSTAPTEAHDSPPQDLMSEEIPVYNPESVVIQEHPTPVAMEIEPPPAALEEMLIESPNRPTPAPTVPEPEPKIETPPEQLQPTFIAPPTPSPPPAEIENKVISPESNPFGGVEEPIAPVPTPAPVPARPAPPRRPAVPPPPAVAKPLPNVEALVNQTPHYEPVIATDPVIAAVQPTPPPQRPAAIVQPTYTPAVAPSQPAPAAASIFGDVDDEFDAFSAKFNSAQKVEKTNIFLEDPAVDGKKN